MPLLNIITSRIILKIFFIDKDKKDEKLTYKYAKN